MKNKVSLEITIYNSLYYQNFDKDVIIIKMFIFLITA
jgi:hypothetical protein